MGIRKIKFASESALNALVGDLESVSAGEASVKGVSLHQSMKNFLTMNKSARDAQTSPQLAESLAPIMAQALNRHLRADGFDSTVQVCRGAKSKLTGCSEFMNEAIREIGRAAIAKDMIHFVVRVGNVVIDLGHRRLGDDYLNSNNAVANHFKQYWERISDVPLSISGNRNKMLAYSKNLVNGSNLKRLINSTGDESQATPLANAPSFQATASDVVVAFSRAQRNRRVR